MSHLDSIQIAHLLEPYIQASPVPEELYVQLSTYLELLLKWNARTNLTAIREPEEIVRRHFGESLFTGLNLPVVETVLDFGSGAGFPGLPIQLLRPDLHVTLAESQNKKASFLREVVRTLGLPTEIWAGRVEAMPTTRRFDLVMLRAVDDMATAVYAALPRAKIYLAVLATDRLAPPALPKFSSFEGMALPNAASQQLLIARRVDD